MQITKEIAQKVIETVSCGLVSGIGQPIPGQMCVEAAVCYAMGLPHSDQPSCVSPALRTLKIRLNDSSWSSNEARTKGLKRLSVLQLGTDTGFDEVEFTKRVAEMVIRKIVPIALRKAAELHPDENHKLALLEAADKCEQGGTQAVDAARAAAAYAYAAASYAAASYAASYAAAASYASYAAARAAAAYAYAARAYATTDAADAADAAARAVDAAKDEVLFLFATEVENILIDMKVPGVQWLDLIN